MFTTTYTDVLSGLQITPAFPQYQLINLTENSTLSWPAQFQNTNKVLAVTMVVAPTADGFNLTLPDARQAGAGFRFTIKNPSIYTFNLLDNTGAIITAIPAATIWEYWLDNNTTQGGSWTQTPYIQGTPVVTSINATSSSNNLVIGGVPITAAGTITFALANDLLSLSSFGVSHGIAVRQDATHWFMRQLTGTNNQINIVNRDGVAGDPTISLVSDVILQNSITAGNLKLGPGNILTSTNPNAPVILAPNGTGVIQFQNNAEILNSSSLSFRNATNHFISFKYATEATVDQTYNWPTAAPLDGQVLAFSFPNLLNWKSVITTGGTTTTNGICRYANTVGGLADSSVTIDNAWNIAGATSLAVGTLGICTTLSNKIITTVANQDLILSPNGNGSTVSLGDLSVQSSLGTQRSLRLYTTDNARYAGFRADPAMGGGSVIWKLPASDSAGVFLSDGFNNTSITPFFLGGTNNRVPTFTTTPGLLQNSNLTIIGTAATGLASCTFGNINVGVTANTISTVANSDLNLAPNGTGNVVSQTDLQIKSAGIQRKIQYWNTAATFYTGLQSAATANATFTLPANLPASAGYIRSDSAGVLTISPLATATNQLAIYTGTEGQLASSGSYLDANNNLLLGNSSIGTLTLQAGANIMMLKSPNFIGAPTGALPANYLGIGGINSTAGDNLALYGGGNVGVSASTTNTVNAKLSIYINGVRYFILLSNNST